MLSHSPGVRACVVQIKLCGEGDYLTDTFIKGSMGLAFILLYGLDIIANNKTLWLLSNIRDLMYIILDFFGLLTGCCKASFHLKYYHSNLCGGFLFVETHFFLAEVEHYLTARSLLQLKDSCCCWGKASERRVVLNTHSLLISFSFVGAARIPWVSLFLSC